VRQYERWGVLFFPLYVGSSSCRCFADAVPTGTITSSCRHIAKAAATLEAAFRQRRRRIPLASAPSPPAVQRIDDGGRRPPYSVAGLPCSTAYDPCSTTSSSAPLVASARLPARPSAPRSCAARRGTEQQLPPHRWPENRRQRVGGCR
jgi:hypothetical protein